METYPHLTGAVPVNIYGIAENSMIDWGSYKKIMGGDHLRFLEIRPDDYGLANLEGACLTTERLILADKARDYFTEQLAPIVNYESKVNDIGELSDTVDIDCSFGAFNLDTIEVYEPCIFMVYQGSQEHAVTVMDGPFASLYPYYVDNMVSLTSVEHTPLKKCKTYAEAVTEITDPHSMTEARISWLRREMENRISHYVPWFQDDYTWMGYRTSIRAVPYSRADSRRCIVTRNDNVISVQPGKIDAIFSAATRVMNFLREIENAH